ncbi:chorismate synthase [Beduini massiliensis]|uniref:chorismate synthase n=1 Tax=Beduini massiliensis TaxID=1585974 RepID=UPI00059AAC8D|nr:chorismate synthase [Beduini massiliensis]
MSANWGKNIELSIFGESHGKAIGINIGKLPAGLKIDMALVEKEMLRRAPGNNKLSTARKEKDQVEIMSGIQDGITTGAPLCAVIYNSDQHSKDYSLLETHMRPGHSDFAAYVKYHGYNDVRGGGHFSGRITAPIVFAGAVIKQILAQQGIYIGAHIKSIQSVQDRSFDETLDKTVLNQLSTQLYPVLDSTVFPLMEAIVGQARSQCDSVGGQIECGVIGLPAGIGEPFFDSLESTIAHLMFSIPAVKGLAFGDGFDLCRMLGSQANDAYYYEEGKVKTKTNHNGGIVGGISNGMPITFTVGIKPTPSIAQKQATINVESKENTEIEIKGRHDPCIVFRAVAVVEAMCAIAIYEAMGGNQ